jgi:hypothetical protein
VECELAAEICPIFTPRDAADGSASLARIMAAALLTKIETIQRMAFAVQD